MARHSRITREQKRKKKVAAKRKQADLRNSRYRGSPLAFRGNDYKTDEYVPLCFAAESAINVADVRSERRLTDWQVQTSLERVVRELRGEDPGPVPPGQWVMEFEDGRTDDLVVRLLHLNLHHFLETEELFSREEVIGVLRTLLNSIKIWSRRLPNSRGYLNMVHDMLQGRIHEHAARRLFGVSAGMEIRISDGNTLLVDEEPEEPEALWELADVWRENPCPENWIPLLEEAQALIEEGNAELVRNACDDIVLRSTDPQKASLELAPILRAARGDGT